MVRGPLTSRRARWLSYTRSPGGRSRQRRSSGRKYDRMARRAIEASLELADRMEAA